MRRRRLFQYQTDGAVRVASDDAVASTNDFYTNHRKDWNSGGGSPGPPERPEAAPCGPTRKAVRTSEAERSENERRLRGGRGSVAVLSVSCSTRKVHL